MFNSYQTNTLTFTADRCNGCGMCAVVCPHAVFARNSRVIRVSQSENCMECGACQVNCPTNAITVQSGVGCAGAMIRAAITGQKDTCGSAQCAAG